MYMLTQNPGDPLDAPHQGSPTNSPRNNLDSKQSKARGSVSKVSQGWDVAQWDSTCLACGRL